jgi:hypothetical protein
MAAAGVDAPTLAGAIGRDASIVYKRLRSGLTDAESDRWAMAVGLHPSEVWGRAWTDLPLLEEAMSA